MPLPRYRQRPTPFHSVREYLTELQALATESKAAKDWEIRCEAALNGQASEKLRQMAPLHTRRKYGAFFTGAELGARLLTHRTKIRAASIFYDATCGMGDLLLAAARLLPLSRDLPATLATWGGQLMGTDVHPEFIAAAKARLVLLARRRHEAKTHSLLDPGEYFPRIRIGDGLESNQEYRDATHLLLNPPFGATKISVDCDWGSGRVSAAKLFVMHALQVTQPGTDVLAILPDVLRAGSFSEAWRDAVSELNEVHVIEPHGIFDKSADIDVFVLKLKKRRQKNARNEKKWPVEALNANTVGDAFSVNVGSVVPYRDKKIGVGYEYIHPRCVPPWVTMTSFSERRKYSGNVFKPPFVVIRRTSRAEHQHRAVATVVSGRKPIAVENHLIVCRPLKPSLAACQHLMAYLRSNEVDHYLNDRIRCRHLTVSAVKGIPYQARL